MKLFIKAKLRSKEARIRKLDDINYEVSVKEPPTRGKANQAIIKAFAEHFDVSIADIKMVSGHTSLNKVIEIL